MKSAKDKPRFCRFCGIGIGEKNSPPKSWGVGLVCKVCTKYMNREKALKYYHTSDIKARRCKEPEKKSVQNVKRLFGVLLASRLLVEIIVQEYEKTGFKKIDI